MKTWMSLTASLAAGVVLFLSAPALAANPAVLTLRVTPSDGLAPDAVGDLLALQAPANGEITLSWTAPADNPSGNVAAYEIRYATFTVAQAGGDPLVWWGLATSFPGVPAPASAGVFEGVTIGGLPAASHIFAIRSRDATNNWSDIGFSNPATPNGVRPAPVAGLLAIRLPDTSVNLNWSPVEINEDGSPAGVADYIVRRSGSLTGPFDITVSSGAGANSFFIPLSTAPISTEYLMISAVDGNGNESNPAFSNLLHVAPSGIIGQVATAFTPAGTFTHAYIPASIMDELASENLLMRVAQNSSSSVNRDPRALGTYEVSFVSPAQDVDKNFTLSRPAMNVVIQSTAPLAGRDVGVLWWNGASWVKVGKVEVDETLNTVSFYTALPGRYQVRTFRAATELTLDKASVFPRIFSPNGDGINDEVLFVIDNPNGAAVDGKIYDVGGNEVATLKRADAGAPTADTLSWNGRDRDGQVVRAGVYVYRVKGEGKTITGTVVVAK